MPNLVEVVLVWPVRPNVDPFSTTFAYKGRRYEIELSFPPLYRVTDDVRLNGLAWSHLLVRWNQEFDQTGDFVTWAKTDKNHLKLAEAAEAIQNGLIDFAKNQSAANLNLACIKHFGPIDWPLYTVSVDGIAIHTELGASAWTQFRSQSSHFLLPGSEVRPIDFADRTLRRASDLARSGYTTEAALLAVAVMDNAVQQYLSKAMKERGVSDTASKNLLRNVTTRRLGTYLDPVLKLICDHSLAQDDGSLYKRVLQVNLDRNEAIHNGAELPRRKALESINVCYAVRAYLSQLKPKIMVEQISPADPEPPEKAQSNSLLSTWLRLWDGFKGWFSGGWPTSRF